VPSSAGPPADGPSTQHWGYRSTVDPTRDTQAGLAGPLIVARPGTLNAEGRPSDVDKEVYLMLQVRSHALVALGCCLRSDWGGGGGQGSKGNCDGGLPAITGGVMWRCRAAMPPVSVALCCCLSLDWECCHAS
jgi:hypothetical protein